MSRVHSTGSAKDQELMAARLLANDGHSITLHAPQCSQGMKDARMPLPAARGIVVGELSSIACIRQIVEQANAVGPYNAVIHNAAPVTENRGASAPMTAWGTSSRSACSPRTR